MNTNAEVIQWLRELAESAAPGPWEWRIVAGPMVQVTAVENTEHVCSMPYETNARLIARAPDLARACAELAEALEATSALLAAEEYDQDFNPELLQARAALAHLARLKP